MRKLLALGVVGSLMLGLAVAAPVSAKTRINVTMTVETYFEVDPNQFESSIEGCEWGDVYSLGDAAFPPVFGVFMGYKVFDCYGEGDTGFVVKLNAKFSYSGGSSGSWTVVDAWGDLAGMSGGGKLVGIPIEGENGITDNYVGTITL